jgi:Tfp pilus assembly protein PilZ
METSDCRRSPRYHARFSLRVQLVDSPEMPEQITESVDISTGGVFFASALPLKVGTPVEIFLEIPNEVGAESSEWRFTGQVVHVRPYFLPFGKSGVGIQFDSCEVLRVADFLVSQDPGLINGDD